MQRIAQTWPGWQADELLGQGAYGKVYKASRTAGGHTSYAAVKVIDIPRDESEVAALRSMGMDALSVRSYFEETARTVVNEVAVMESLKGAPNVVGIEDYQLLEHGDGVGWTILIRMELLEALTTHIARVGMPDARETAKIGVDLCRALEFCHNAGVIHRDVKPENVFVSKFGDYKLGDFGLSRRLGEGSRSTKSVAGTSDYMAPEVESGHYDKTVDVYSLGVMLYRWLNGGRPPFVGATETPTRAALEGARHRRLTGERPPLPAGDGVPQDLAAAVRKAVEPVPANRWQSAEALGTALQGWLDGRPVGIAQRGEDVRIAVSVPAEMAGPGGVAEVGYKVAANARRLQLHIPAGTQDGTELRFAGFGCPGTGGAAAGDLLVTVSVQAPTTPPMSQAPIAALRAGGGPRDNSMLMRIAALLAVVAALARGYIASLQTGPHPSVPILILANILVVALAFRRSRGIEKALAAALVADLAWSAFVEVHTAATVLTEGGDVVYLLGQIVGTLPSQLIDAAVAITLVGPRRARPAAAKVATVCAAIVTAFSLIVTVYGPGIVTSDEGLTRATALVLLAHAVSLALVSRLMAGRDDAGPRAVA